MTGISFLSTETVKGTTGALEGVHDVESSDGFAKQDIRGEKMESTTKGAHRLACSV